MLEYAFLQLLWSEKFNYVLILVVKSFVCGILFRSLVTYFFILKKHGYFCTTNDKYHEKVQCLQLSLNIRSDF